MTHLSPGATWQRPKAAEWFLDERQARLPLIDVQEDVIRRLFVREMARAGNGLDADATPNALDRA